VLLLSRPVTPRRALGLATLLTVSACAEPWVSSHDSAIVGGTIATGDPAVAAVLIQMPDGTTVAICTGTLISPRVVLTAAHCVSINDPKIPGAAAKQVFFGSSVESRPIALIDVEKSTFHTGYDENRLDAGNDIALLLLEHAPTGITPLPINRQSMASQIGATTRLVGFGITQGGLHDDGTKRQVTTTIGDVDERLLWVLDGTRNTCNGDSGGPSFVTVGGREVIAGVTSFGDTDCIEAGAYTRVDLFASAWIDPWVTANDPPAGSDSCGRDGMCRMGCVPVDPDCQTTTPPRCVADGVCVEECTTATPDPDCGDDPNLTDDETSPNDVVVGGCSVGGGARGGGLAALLLLLALVRRRRASA
jgi:MYXO-CTERM domain-containing protein